jgi:hypothetical protein
LTKKQTDQKAHAGMDRSGHCEEDRHAKEEWIDAFSEKLRTEFIQSIFTVEEEG